MRTGELMVTMNAKRATSSLMILVVCIVPTFQHGHKGGFSGAYSGASAGSYAGSGGYGGGGDTLGEELGHNILNEVGKGIQAIASGFAGAAAKAGSYGGGYGGAGGGRGYGGGNTGSDGFSVGLGGPLNIPGGPGTSDIIVSVTGPDGGPQYPYSGGYGGAFAGGSGGKNRPGGHADGIIVTNIDGGNIPAHLLGGRHNHGATDGIVVTAIKKGSGPTLITTTDIKNGKLVPRPNGAGCSTGCNNLGPNYNQQPNYYPNSPGIIPVENQKYAGPFPGPTGSINDYKPATGTGPGCTSNQCSGSSPNNYPQNIQGQPFYPNVENYNPNNDQKYTGPFPGPSGSIHNSKPAIPGSTAGNNYGPGEYPQDNVSGVTIGASCVNGRCETAGHKYTGPFPGPQGSIFDSKPVPSVHGGVPPGHGGVPPGHGGVPPGHGGVPPGHGGVPPGHGGVPPGHGGVPPGHGGVPPGHGGVPPGHGGVPPGHGGVPPGHGGVPPGHGSGQPGQGVPPGHQGGVYPNQPYPQGEPGQSYPPHGGSYNPANDHKYTGPFPGPPGSIHDSKPAPGKGTPNANAPGQGPNTQYPGQVPVPVYPQTETPNAPENDCSAGTGQSCNNKPSQPQGNKCPYPGACNNAPSGPSRPDVVIVEEDCNKPGGCSYPHKFKPRPGYVCNSFGACTPLHPGSQGPSGGGNNNNYPNKPDGGNKPGSNKPDTTSPNYGSQKPEEPDYEDLQFGKPNKGGQNEQGPNYGYQNQGPNYGGQNPTGPNPGGQPNHGGQPSGPNHGGQPSGPNHGGQPSRPNQGGQPSGPNHGSQPSEPNQGGQPNHGGQPSGPNHGGQPSGPNHGGQPSGPNQGGQPSGPNHGSQPSEPNHGGQPSGPNHGGQPSGPNHGGQPSGGQPAEPNYEQQPNYGNLKPHNPNYGGQPSGPNYGSQQPNQQPGESIYNQPENPNPDSSSGTTCAGLKCLDYLGNNNPNDGAGGYPVPPTNIQPPYTGGPSDGSTPHSGTPTDLGTSPGEMCHGLECLKHLPEGQDGDHVAQVPVIGGNNVKPNKPNNGQGSNINCGGSLCGNVGGTGGIPGTNPESDHSAITFDDSKEGGKYGGSAAFAGAGAYAGAGSGIGGHEGAGHEPVDISNLARAGNGAFAGAAAGAAAGAGAFGKGYPGGTPHGVKGGSYSASYSSAASAASSSSYSVSSHN